MDDLFEKLKAEPPVNRDNAKAKTARCDSPRRDSLPALNSRTIESPSVNKCRSVSPTTCEDLPTNIVSKENSESRKKQMPTKAQQKLFEPIEEKAATAVNDKFKVRSCKVRIKQDDLVQLRNKFSRDSAKRSKNASKSEQKPTATKEKAAVKRKAESGNSPPAKKGRKSKEQLKQKKGTGFFIKLANSPPSTKKTPPSSKKTPTSAKKATVSKPRPKSQTPTTTREVRKVNVNSPTWTTKATKFTRTQLIKSFGKHYFNWTVKIERCRHPLMLTFDSNERARKQQARNKSKNLSVSFKEQVEIIGCSDTESNYSEENVAAVKSSDEKSKVATPARLKKIENGKVIDDIEFDPSLFIDPSIGSDSSTPLRKKTEKKSYSPLKDDSSSSARSEQLKLANEKLPPCGLRRLRDSTPEDEDDEDDECEYIVPIDLPEKRSSRTSSLNNTIDSTAATQGSDVDGMPTVCDTTEASGDDQPESSPGKLDKAFDELNSENKTDDKEEANLLKKDADDSVTQKVSELTKIEKQNDIIEQINGNGTAAETTESHHKKDDDCSNEEVRDENQSMNKLVLENDSRSVTPTISFASDSQDNISPKIVKTSIDRLSKDIEMPKIDNGDEKELSKNVNKITEDNKTTIST